MKKITFYRKWLIFLTCFCLLFSIEVKLANADCLVNVFSKGWYSSDGIHRSWNENTLTGAVPQS
jgi:hypothetical protein